METTNKTATNVKDEGSKTRNTSKVTLMKSFKSLIERIEETKLLTKEDAKILKEQYEKAFANFIKSF